MKKVEPESVAHEEEPFILDVRHSVEYRQTHVPGSYLLPLHLLEPEKVPHLAVSLGLALALGSLGFLLYFIHHVAQSIQAENG